MSLRDISGPWTVTVKITLTCNYEFLCKRSPRSKKEKEKKKLIKLHFAEAKVVFTKLYTVHR